MRKSTLEGDEKRPKRTAMGTSRVPFEWPLLIYPVLFLATLLILHMVGRSMEKETPSHPIVRDPAVAPHPVERPDRALDGAVNRGTSLASGATPRPLKSMEIAAGAESQSPTPRDDVDASRGDGVSAAAGKVRRTIDPNQLKGPAKTVALLCRAVDEKDHTRMKQCLAELVAMGDEAVGPLRELIANEQGDAALWAATALARIGTPTATGALLDRLAQSKDGRYKEELSKRTSYISNHDSWPLLLDTMLQETDGAVVRAAGAALAAMADAPIIDEVMARYSASSNAMEADRLAQFIRSIHSPQATEALLSLAGPVSSAPQDSLQSAAIEALARVGDAQSISYLLRRLEASAPGQDMQIFNIITRIDNPEAQNSLLYAAAGNKEVSAEHGQTAAIYALKNYPDEKTVTLLERIAAQAQNEKVLTAATRTLDEIRRSAHTVTAKADALQRSEEMLPLAPLEK